MSKYIPKIQLMDIDKIHPYDKNAKIHSSNQIESLVKVIKSQGWDVPIVVDRYGSIIKGHGRRLAALSMGLTQVPVIVRDDLTDEQVKAARLSDNRVAMGDFDVDAIKDELASLKSDGFDLSEMGFGEKELDMMLGDLDKMDIDVFNEDAPETVTHTDISGATHEVPVNTTEAPESAPAAILKPVALVDMLGFKHLPGEYKEALVAFQALAESQTGKTGAEAFGEMIKALLEEANDE